MKVLLICLLFVNPVYTMQEEKLSNPSEIIHYHHLHPKLPTSASPIKSRSAPTSPIVHPRILKIRNESSIVNDIRMPDLEPIRIAEINAQTQEEKYISKERHHHTKKSITITVDDRDGNSPPIKIPFCSSKVKISIISASALVITSGISAFIAWKTKNCGD